MYEAKKFEQLLGLEGISEKMLNNHFALYEGYVANTNKLIEALEKMKVADQMATAEFAEITRRFGWEFDGMRLHELYFENLSKGAAVLDENSSLGQKMVEQFGSFENWEKHFKALATMRGIGWVVLYQDGETGNLFNAWIGEHDGGHLAGAKPLLVLDVFEHAYMTDYEIKRAGYVEAIFKSIDWKVVEKRFLAA